MMTGAQNQNQVLLHLYWGWTLNSGVIAACSGLTALLSDSSLRVPTDFLSLTFRTERFIPHIYLQVFVSIGHLRISTVIFKSLLHHHLSPGSDPYRLLGQTHISLLRAGKEPKPLLALLLLCPAGAS